MTGGQCPCPCEDRLAALERKVRELEDRLAIYQLIASYGPAADGLSRTGLESLWAADGTYDTEHHVFEGAHEIGAIVDDHMHLGFVEAGCAHVLSLPHVVLDGDQAVATNHSNVFVRDGDEWRAVRTAANRWELVRADDGVWRAERRVNRLLNGSKSSRSLMARGVEPGINR